MRPKNPENDAKTPENEAKTLKIHRKTLKFTENHWNHCFLKNIQEMDFSENHCFLKNIQEMDFSEKHWFSLFSRKSRNKAVRPLGQSIKAVRPSSSHPSISHPSSGHQSSGHQSSVNQSSGHRSSGHPVIRSVSLLAFRPVFGLSLACLWPFGQSFLFSEKHWFICF